VNNISAFGANLPTVNGIARHVIIYEQMDSIIGRNILNCSFRSKISLDNILNLHFQSRGRLYTATIVQT